MRGAGVGVMLALWVLPGCGTLHHEGASCRTGVTVTGKDGHTVTLDADAGANGFGERDTYFYVGAADFKLDHSVPVLANGADEGQHLLILALRAGDADHLSSGDLLRLKRNSLDFDAAFQSSDSLNSMVRHKESGTVRIRELTGDRICIDIDYENSVIKIKGTIDTPLKREH